MKAISKTAFKNAALYRNLIREPTPEYNAGKQSAFTERHLQCVWYDSKLRPANLESGSGESVTVESPGRWNLEAGPDFLDAALLVGTEQRRITGDVEIHARPSDWTAHRHAQDIRYAKVKAHVTYFPGTPQKSALPPGAISISLKNKLLANPFFSFDNIDLQAYPFARISGKTPCSEITEKWPPEKIAILLTAAGEERLRAKTTRMAAEIQDKGAEQCLYEEIMRALGYKKNREQFHRLATVVPLQSLRELSELTPINAYAILAGVAGLLPKDMNKAWNDKTRAWTRKLWDIWWKHQTRWQQESMDKTQWNFSGIRPQNRPERRLMAAAILFCSEEDLLKTINTISAEHPRKWNKELTALLRALPDNQEYLDTRLGWNAKQTTKPVAYIGQGTAAAIVSNVIIPCLAASGRTELTTTHFLSELPPETDNAIIRQTAFNLLGPDYNPVLYRKGIMQQGLIQIFQNFCIDNKTRCKECALKAKLADF